MAVLKCKMCGGELHFEKGATVCECEYCGSMNTLPVVDSDQEMNLFNRANHFRMANEFDKAVNAYEKILDQDDSNAEAHWGIVLSRYGIEYVEDPKTHERIPTCHRVQLTSILSDPDYQAALEHADMIAKSEYQAQAERIAQIQKGILAISSKEDPYDIFICYKESDDSGKRTVDSTLAQDIYYGLTDAGYRVFFSRITLEDKLGQEYEPYIFAALNSAKVMVVVGTKSEYFNAVWVKNEWSRYLDLMKLDRGKTLIPCYRDMNPYDLPDDLSILQSQDMSRIGFMQDLIRGIEKLIEKSDINEHLINENQTEINSISPTVTSLLKRVFIFLEDKKWDRADEYCEKVLDLDPENPDAYLGKVLAKYKISSKGGLANASRDYRRDSNYIKALNFASENFRKEIERFQGQYESNVYRRRQQEDNEAVKSMNECEQKILQAFEEYADQCLPWKKHCDLSIAEAQAQKEQAENEIKSLRSFSPIKKSQLNRKIQTLSKQIDDLENSYRERSQPYFINLLRNENEAFSHIHSSGEKIIIEHLNQKYGKKIIPLLSDFGRYHKNTGLDKSPIEWILVRCYPDRALLVSKYGVDCKKYHDQPYLINWENCYLRKWLNTDFLISAFSEEERKRIMKIEETEYKTFNQQIKVFDRVFIFDEDEANHYLRYDAHLKPTPYAQKSGVKVDSDGYCRWWLREPYDKSTVKTKSTEDYNLYSNKKTIDTTSEYVAVRPALWIKNDLLDAIY